MRSDEGYAKTLHESHGMARPAAGAVVSPAVRHFIAHLHRAAHHIHTDSAASK